MYTNWLFAIDRDMTEVNSSMNKNQDYSKVLLTLNIWCQ